MAIGRASVFARQPRAGVALVPLGCNSEPREILNNQRRWAWHFRCTHTHSVFERPGREQIMPDLIMLQRVAERAVPPASRAEDPGKWRKWGMVQKRGLAGNSHIDSRTCDSKPWNRLRPSHPLVRVGCDGELAEIVNNQRKLIWRFRAPSATRFPDRPDGDLSVPIC